jgi:hypothetical protein
MVTAQYKYVPPRYHYEPWDSFLDEKVRVAVEGFRKIQWSNLWRELRVEHGIYLPRNLEPHWTEPGRAVFWHQQTVTRRPFDSETGTYGDREDITTDWKLTAPVRANNAGQIAVYLLKKGWHLRSPSDDGVVVDVEAPPAEQTETSGETVYKCRRHPKGVFRSKKWDAYRMHCLHGSERLEETPPADVLVKMQESKYYCLSHDASFKSLRGATIHSSHYSPKYRWEPKPHEMKIKIKQKNGESQEEPIKEN